MDNSAPVRIPASIVVPPTQNTAPVLEFRCLYTSDLRRKQKRWQDGILKFHTFNKRVMVYDDRGNFVGDTHWREDYTFEEGEELDLERNGTLVQVSECIGKRDQDLTDLLEKRVKERGDRVLARAVASSPGRKLVPITQTQAANGPQEDPSQQRSMKRRKPSSSPACKVGYAQTLTGATLNLSGTPLMRKPLRYDTLWSQALRKPTDTLNPPVLYRDHLQCHTGQVAEDVSLKQTSGGQNKKNEKPTPPQERMNYVSDTTGAPSMLSRKEPTNFDLLPYLTCQEEPGELLQRASDRTVDLEVDNIDVTVTDKAPLLHEQLKDSPSARYPVPIRTEKFSQLPPRRQILKSDECQEGRHSNPLRIKPRPKRKLLLSTGPQTHSPLPPTGIVQGLDEAVQPAAPQVAFKRGLKLSHPVSVGHYDDNAHRDKGPWSREAFDLFGWDPKATASLNPVPP